MKKYIFSIILTVGLICNTEEMKANHACTRAWGNAVNYITNRHMEDQAACVVGMMQSWMGGLGILNAISSIFGMSCSEEAWNDFSDSLDIAAAQYEACIA